MPFSLLNAGLIFGAVALAIPIIIHLFHKSRFKIVKWGAMHLLEAVLRTNQRRIQIEQWILLAIRCAIPALLALAMARPLWKGASSLLGNAKTSTVVLLDNSYSMDAARAGTTSFGIARDETLRLINELRTGSEVHVIMMGEGGRGLLDAPSYDLSRVTQALTKSSAGFGSARIPAALDLGAGALEKMHESARQVVVLTDFQRVSFPATEDALIERALQRIRSLPAGPNVTFWDVGQEVKENVAVESLDFSRLMVGVGQKVQIRANLRNFGDANHADLRVTFKVDGKDKAASQVALGPHAKAQVLFTHAFDAAGSHVVEVSTEPDVLAADNTFLASIPVRDRLPVLLVDGAPGATPDDIASETGYLQIALSPFAAGKVELSDLLEPHVITADAFSAKNLADTSAVVLANVRKLTPEQLRVLEDFVKNGGGLLVFPGDRTDSAWWNGPFATLAPVPLAGISGELKDASQGTGIAAQRFENPALEIFNDPRNGSMTEAAIKVWFKMKSPASSGDPNDPVVLARLDSGDPFLVERAVGHGRVIACSSAADADWGNLPARPFYLPLVQRLCVHLASTVNPPRNLDVGRSLVSFLPTAAAGKKALLTGPDGTSIELPIVKRDELGVVETAPLYQPGLYTLQPPGGQPIHYVVNADRRESDLARLADTEIAEFAKAHSVAVVHSSAEFRENEHRQRFGEELWKWVLLGLLAFIFLELILQRKFAGARARI
ncbi:MAG: BatA domain-containing protein [Chthoniobacteraceae bacterium]